ncbi:LysR substrate-binding domain-containing protein [uncultured Roseobacter sp.]|uniref:LysR substrate-binding domain-containing protein n=1 Tax=uncultured Roseobacter sp. TaxID=114847 RepID=UPI0026031E41|nr:LysR substrate-binding domain-containing protein [uncultured Roseobacter sp.]
MQNLNAIPLSALRTIEVIARTGSLRAAAEELRVTPGALSQRLAKAEAALGQVLFTRSSTGLQPTDLCAQMAPRLTAALAELSSVVSDVEARGRNTLTVTVAPIFASRWLIWRIKRFNDLYPEVSLRVLPAVNVVDLDRSEVDVGIRVGDDPALGVGATKLLDQRVFPVCAPEIARQITTLDDLFRWPVIRETEALYGWQDWLAAVGAAGRVLPPGPTYADASLCLDAAMTGQGIFMAWESLASDALARGQISAPMDVRAKTRAAYWFAVRNHSRRNPSVWHFKRWLETELGCAVQSWTAQHGADAAPAS